MASRASRWWLAVGAVCAGSACAARSAPEGWLPPAKDLPRWTRGAWIEVKPAGGAQRRVAGELIAVGADELHVLTTDGVRTVASSGVAAATLILYQAEDSGGFGLAISLTHGRYLPLTLIPWLAIGSGELAAPRLRHPPGTLESFRPYARFPQGLPEGLAPAELGPLARPRRTE